ncbi:unnamed protein product [Pleuronectes platessa]|uniref:Uncharacterized protein n=1 Tax=Pleuronectes platessa TaxID=8262 RepID=A0A9N7Z3P3_PLEPL|nr:unnamed protein product [Pleuronectes platessa]
MRPSISVTLEPGLEQGGPWGRDLYTFVTSAAGHMMRTLQKPRKNRPSKRQVNHRRFLHNMIQRKFADIEAANQRIASESSLQRETPAAGSPSQSGHLQDPEKGSDHTDADDVSNSVTKVSDESHQTEVTEKKHPDSKDLWKPPRKSQPNTCTTVKNSQGKGRKKKRSGNRKLVEFTSLSSPDDTHYYQRAEVYDSPLKSIDNLPEDTSLQNSSFDQFGQNTDTSPSFSPELSPLSLDSCDFSIQMFTDVSPCTQAQRSIADIAESPWADIMDLFSVGGKDLGGCLEVGTYFQSICAEVGADDSTFTDQTDLAPNQLPTSTSCYYMTNLQTHQPTEDLSPCKLLNCDKNQRFTPFEGVAQSFSAPLHNPVHHPVPTPPHEQDWLFPDILKERKSPVSVAVWRMS